jgi:acetyltransferase-like isoleucine patch superfamily enzyme
MKLRQNNNLVFRKLEIKWTRFWMGYAGLTRFGRFATRLATLFAPPHKASASLARMNRKGYIAPSATLYHPAVQFGANVFIGDRVIIFQAKNGGPVKLGDRVCILRDTIIETGEGGKLSLGNDVYIHPRCQLNAYLSAIEIGCGVLIAANCALYPHNHGISPKRPIREQPLQTKGPIIIGEHAWLGAGVIVLGKVRIGKGAVIGAGSVVTNDIPDMAIATGVPARIVKMRTDLINRSI